MGKIVVGKASDIPPGKMQKVTADGKDVLLVNIDGYYYAIDDTCTHAGASISEGSLDGSIITCGWHGAKFDCNKGKLSAFLAKIQDLSYYTVVVESEHNYLKV